ncbi:hypothetical protein JTS93_19360 [Clostridium botulinum]|nr:hypothetical protein [Clostridium botulinum]
MGTILYVALSFKVPIPSPTLAEFKPVTAKICSASALSTFIYLSPLYILISLTFSQNHLQY